MDEDGTPQAVGTPSLPESKMHTEPKQLATKSAPTVEEPAEKLSPSHTMALQPSCRKGPVLEDPPIGVKISDYYNPDPYSMRMNYLPMVCEHRQTPTTETAGHVSMAHGAPLREGRPDALSTDPSPMPPVSRVKTTRQQLRQAQTSPVERSQPNRAESGAAHQADVADLQDYVTQEMTTLYPLIVDLHTASLGNILALAQVISDLMRHPIPPQVARHILRPQDDRSVQSPRLGYNHARRAGLSNRIIHGGVRHCTDV